MLTHNIMPETVVQNVHSYYAIKVEEIAAPRYQKQERRNNKFPLWAFLFLLPKFSVPSAESFNLLKDVLLSYSFSLFSEGI